MAVSSSSQLWLMQYAILLLTIFVSVATSMDMFLDWKVSTDLEIKPVSPDQPVKIQIIVLLYISIVIIDVNILKLVRLYTNCKIIIFFK